MIFLVVVVSFTHFKLLTFKELLLNSNLLYLFNNIACNLLPQFFGSDKAYSFLQYKRCRRLH